MDVTAPPAAHKRPEQTMKKDTRKMKIRFVQTIVMTAAMAATIFSGLPSIGVSAANTSAASTQTPSAAATESAAAEQTTSPEQVKENTASSSGVSSSETKNPVIEEEGSADDPEEETETSFEDLGDHSSETHEIRNNQAAEKVAYTVVDENGRQLEEGTRKIGGDGQGAVTFSRSTFVDPEYEFEYITIEDEFYSGERFDGLILYNEQESNGSETAEDGSTNEYLTTFTKYAEVNGGGSDYLETAADLTGDNDTLDVTIHVKASESEKVIAKRVPLRVSYKCGSTAVPIEAKLKNIGTNGLDLTTGPEAEGYSYDYATVNGQKADFIQKVIEDVTDDDGNRVHLTYYTYTASDGEAVDVTDYKKALKLVFHYKSDDGAGSGAFAADYVDRDGNTVRDSETLEVTKQTSLVRLAPQIEGYTYSRQATIETEDGTESVTRIAPGKYYNGDEWVTLGQDATITFVYMTDEEAKAEEEQSYTFTAHYVDAKGDDLQEPETLTVEDADHALDFTAGSPDIPSFEGYTFQKVRLGRRELTALSRTDEGAAYYTTIAGKNYYLRRDADFYFVYTLDEETINLQDGFRAETSDGTIVLAKLADSEAVPANTKFRVQEVTDGEIFDKYLAALQAYNPDAGYTAQNTLLYDIAFFNGGKEIEPAEGSVDITMNLSDEKLGAIGASSTDELAVNHLPLSASAKESADTTLAADFTEDDVSVENVDSSSVTGNAVSFTLDSLSVASVYNYKKGTDGKLEEDNTSLNAKTSSDLTAFVEEATIGQNASISDDKKTWTITDPNSPVTITLKFLSGKYYQFLTCTSDKEYESYYKLPDGFTADDAEGQIKSTAASGGANSYYTISGNVLKVKLQEGTLTSSTDSAEPGKDWKSFTIAITGKIDNGTSALDFNGSAAGKSGQRIVKNIKFEDETLVSGSITWKDPNDKKPSAVTVNLYQEGQEGNTTALQSVSVGAEDNWTYSFKNLAKNDSSNKPIRYRVTTSSVSGFSVSQMKGHPYSFTYTSNSSGSSDSPGDTQKLSVKVTWSDSNNKYKIRPESVNVDLLRDGETVESATLDASNHWTTYWKEMPKKDENGEDYIYTVAQSNLPDAYTESVSGTKNFTITNKLSTEAAAAAKEAAAAAEKASQTAAAKAAKYAVTGKVSWEDNDNAGGQRPEFVIVHLFAGEKEIAALPASEETKWEYDFLTVPKYDENGDIISYKLTEDPVAGYTSKVVATRSSEAIKFTVTNSLGNGSASGSSGSGSSDRNGVSGGSSGGSGSSGDGSGSSGTRNHGSDATGDNSHMTVYGIILALAGVALIAWFFAQRRRKSMAAAMGDIAAEDAADDAYTDSCVSNADDADYGSEGMETADPQSETVVAETGSDEADESYAGEADEASSYEDESAAEAGSGLKMMTLGGEEPDDNPARHQENDQYDADDVLNGEVEIPVGPDRS